MAFLFYFAVLLFAAASAVFGLDLMTSPLPQHDTKPAVAASADASQQAKKVATRDQNKAKSDSTLPAAKPAKPKSEVRTVYPPSNPALAAVVAKQNEAGAGAQKSQQQSTHAGADARTQQASAQPGENAAAPSEANAARAEATGSTPPKLTDGATVADQSGEQTPNHCNVQACASAYHSFRASDCTYQPYEGPRRLCTKSAVSPRVASQPQSQDRRQVRRDADRYSGLRDAGRRARAARNPDDRYDAYDDASIFGSLFGQHNRRVIVVPDGRYGDYYYR